MQKKYPVLTVIAGIAILGLTIGTAWISSRAGNTMRDSITFSNRR